MLNFKPEIQYEYIYHGNFNLQDVGIGVFQTVSCNKRRNAFNRRSALKAMKLNGLLVYSTNGESSYRKSIAY